MIESLIISFTLTLFIEISAGAALGVRTKRDFLLIALVNLVTNPLLVQILNTLSYLFNRRPVWYLILFLEATVVIVEGLLYRNRLNYKKINPFIFSFILNAISYFGGSFIYEVFTKIF